MPNFNKFDLMEMSDIELLNVAHDFGIFPTGKESKEEVVYQIIAAEGGNIALIEDGDEITIDFSGELKPMVVKREGDDSLIQIISPVRTYH